MEPRLCPQCGAYWQCDCRLDAPASTPDLSSTAGIDPPRVASDAGCPHDWADAVGVDVDVDLDLSAARIVVCRLCGLYAVQERV